MMALALRCSRLGRLSPSSTKGRLAALFFVGDFGVNGTQHEGVVEVVPGDACGDEPAGVANLLLNDPLKTVKGLLTCEPPTIDENRGAGCGVHRGSDSSVLRHCGAVLSFFQLLFKVFQFHPHRDCMDPEVQSGNRVFMGKEQVVHLPESAVSPRPKRGNGSFGGKLGVCVVRGRVVAEDELYLAGVGPEETVKRGVEVTACSAGEVRKYDQRGKWLVVPTLGCIEPGDACTLALVGVHQRRRCEGGNEGLRSILG